MGVIEPMRGHRPLHAGGRQVLIALAAAAVYFGGRVIVEGDRENATRNAERILRFERAFGLDVELSVQDLVVDRPVLRTLGNLSYVWLHWPLLVGVMLLLWRVNQIRFRQLRNTLIASSFVGLVLFTVFPAAPPRFMPGYEGTVSDEARRHYLDYPLSWTNQVASFPSFHVGWTLVACMAVAATLGRSWMRVAAMVPAVLVGMAVVTTGNHYLVDAVAGFAISVGAWIGFEHRQRRVPGGDPMGLGRLGQRSGYVGGLVDIHTAPASSKPRSGFRSTPRDTAATGGVSQVRRP